MLFQDRHDAGRRLAKRLAHLAGSGVIVLALPRGGVPVGHEVAEALGAPLDVFLVRKLGVPGQEELAMGAIASGGVRILNDRVLQIVQPSEDLLELMTEYERREIERREQDYRGNRPPLDLRGKTVILVDDGLATGATMRAAVTAVRRLEPLRVVVAVPVGAAETCEELVREADEVICLRHPDPFHAVGNWYEDFTQTTDEEVQVLLSRSPSNSALARARSLVAEANPAAGERTRSVSGDA